MRADHLIDRIDAILAHLDEGEARKSLEALRLDALRERTREDLETSTRLELERVRRARLPKALARELGPHTWDGR